MIHMSCDQYAIHMQVIWNAYVGSKNIQMSCDWVAIITKARKHNDLATLY